MLKIDRPVYSSILFFFGVFLAQCSSDNHKEKNTYEKNLYIINRIENNAIIIDHDSLSSPNDSKIIYYTDNKKDNCIYSLNKLNNSIEKYSFDGHLINRVILEKEGPNGVGVISNFYIKSPDSIFVLSTFQYKIGLINGLGKLIRSYSFIFNNAGREKIGEGLISYGNYSNQMLVKNGFLYVGATPFDDPTERRYYDKGKSGLMVNLDNGKLDFLTFLPEKWLSLYDDGYVLTGNQTELGQTYNMSKNRCLISYRTDEQVYEVDLLSKKVIPHLANSNLFKEIEWYKKSKAMKRDINETFDYFTKQPQYSSIYYDPYRNIYLRFVGHPNKRKKNEMDGIIWFIYSVILIDGDFNILGETLLEEGYTPTNVLITKKGIYVNRYKNDEKHSYYSLFTVEKNK